MKDKLEGSVIFLFVVSKDKELKYEIEKINENFEVLQFQNIYL